ncbi:type II toxin-antitoxin system RelE/ParE family toxin [Streptomyces sp. NBC_01808]|uniref:type II toxin-antitoxin system RelE family toxin n=1 Tax=Streptomyces sp. NBC_01808 TaxID=2975947 RepID=UPI002DDC375B|nr:type II toxin-antitoxin system RelE/ParE family toxin [Streptomyces sp. NBC_01808]WSA39747.1 type II toxin-antitoxin system RelE/ParE family toxin [Streptomyces sp. NBC_01808]
MSHEVVWETDAVNAATGFLADDPAGLRALIDGIDALAAEQRPKNSAPWGTDKRRLRIGRYRAIYRIDDGRVTVLVLHVGRGAA